MLRRIGLLCLLMSACGGLQERECPAPIGTIVLEDCEVYNRRFEQLQVDVRALLGTAEAQATIERRKLRGRAQAGEALDVLAHRLYALCRDHNACRTDRAAWLTERDRIDASVTKIQVLTTRLRDEPDAKAREKLQVELVAALAGLHAEDEPQRRHFSSWLPWMGARFRPPQPDAPARAPRLMGVDPDTQAQFASGKGIVGFLPTVRVDLWYENGAFAADDAVVLDFGDGHVSACPVRGRGNGEDHASVGCKGPEDLVLRGSYDLSVRYRTGIDGTERVIGHRKVPILAATGDYPDKPASIFDVDLDPDARRGTLHFVPHDGALPSKVDQPVLDVVLKLRDYHREVTARCAIDGKDAFGALTAKGGGQAGTHQDQARYRTVKPGSSVAVAHPFIEWWRYRFPLPLGVPRDGKPLPDDLAPWPRAGKWQCTVTIAGEPARRLRFTVKPDGTLKALPAQLAEPRAEWLLETTVLPTGAEEKL